MVRAADRDGTGTRVSSRAARVRADARRAEPAAVPALAASNHLERWPQNIREALQRWIAQTILLPTSAAARAAANRDVLQLLGASARSGICARTNAAGLLRRAAAFV